MQNLKEQLSKWGIPQQRVAEKAGVNVSHVNTVLNDELAEKVRTAANDLLNNKKAQLLEESA